MKPALYLETSIIGYLTSRFTRDIITAGRQELTREWWNTERERYELFVSPFVLEKSKAGDPEAATERVRMIEDLEFILPDERSDELAGRLLGEVPLPKKATVDAQHISIAAVQGMDYLLTWNLKHIANAALRDRIEQICRSSGYKPSCHLHSGRNLPRDTMIIKNDPSDWRAEDEVMKEIRAIREAYAARFDYDLRALSRHAREVAERERQKGRKVVRRDPKPVNELAAVPE